MPADPTHTTRLDPPAALVRGEACWNRIGIWSQDGASCPELTALIHCHHCPVFAAAGRRLFDRPVPPALLAERTAELAEVDIPNPAQRDSLTVFRLAAEWLALPTRAISEVTDPAPVHHLPHRSGRVLLGLTAIRGDLHPAMSLPALLALPRRDAPSVAARAIPRMLLLRHGNDRFAVAVDEVLGIFPRANGAETALPATLSGVDRQFIAAAVQLADHLVGILDAELVVYGFSRALT